MNTPEFNEQPIEGDIPPLTEDLEAFLEEQDQGRKMGQKLLLASRECEKRVINRLVEDGLDIPNTPKIGIQAFTAEKMFEYFSTLSPKVKNESKFMGLPLTGAERSASLLAHASTIAIVLSHYEDPETVIERESLDGEEESTTWFKRETQLKILDDERITEQDKAALLTVFDDFVPVNGLDLTDQATVDGIRRQDEWMDRRKERLQSLRDLLGSIAREELVPVYGEHDDYDKLIGHLSRYIHLREVNDSAYNILMDGSLDSALSVAESIGISPEELESLVTRVIDVHKTD